MFPDSNPQDLFAGVSVTGAGVFYGAVFPLDEFLEQSIHFFWGAITGVLEIQRSNKTKPTTADDTDWNAVPLALAIASPAGVAGGDFADLTGVKAMFMRVKFTSSGAAGALAAWAFGLQRPRR